MAAQSFAEKLQHDENGTKNGKENGCTQNDSEPPAKRPHYARTAASPTSSADSPDPTPAPAPPLAAQSFAEKLRFVKQQLGLESVSAAHLALARANELMSLMAQGSLPEQLDRLFAMIS